MPATIKAGISISLSGQFQAQGQQALVGINAWAADLNRAGGLAVADRRQRLPVSVVYYDDASRTKGTVRATERLILQDRVDLLFGPYSSGLAQAAAEVAAEHGRLLWNQGGASDNIYQPGRRIVGILTPASEYLTALPGLVRQAAPNARTFALVRCSVGAFPRQVSDGLEGQALALGFKKVLHHEFTPDTANFSNVLDLVQQAKPDLLLSVGRIRHDIALAGQLALRRVSEGALGETPGAVAVVAAPIEQFRAALGDNTAGFIGPSQWEPTADAPAANTASNDAAAHILGGSSFYGPPSAPVIASLTRESRAAGNLAVNYPMAQAYAAGLIAQRCILEAGTLVDTALWEAAAGLDFSTFYGRFRIDPENGRQVGRSLVLVQWQQGRKATLWPPAQDQAALAYPWPASNRLP